MLATKNYDENDVDAAREYVEGLSLGLTLFSHGLYTYMTSGEAHATEGEGEHKH